MEDREGGTKKAKKGSSAPAYTTEQHAAASKIQGLYRKRKARKYTLMLLNSIYQRVYDEENKRYYYYNKRTKQSTWTKPALLGSKDIQLSPRTLKEKQQRDYVEYKKEKDRKPEVVMVVREDKMGPPPIVKAKAWTKRAAVYWLHPPVEKAPKPITGYKIKRHRLVDGEWVTKGETYCPPRLEDRESRHVFNELYDLNQYKFEVIPYWTDQFGRESDGKSTISNIVIPKPILPMGWEAKLDGEKVFYYNNATKETTWDVPDIGPWTLPIKLEKEFSKREIEKMKAEFQKFDVDMSGALNVSELEELVMGLGLRMPRADIIKLMEAVDKDCSGVVEFHEYVQLMLDIRKGTAPTSLESLSSSFKKTNQLTAWAAKELVTEWREALVLSEDVEKSDQEVLDMLHEDPGTLDDWAQDYSLGDIYYFNKKTKQSCFKVPEEVRYFVPIRVKRLFTQRELMKYRQQFDLYDDDGSGKIGPRELKAMWEKLGESVSKERLQTILVKVDVNNDGELDFKEFVGMMLMFKLSNPKLTLKSLFRAAVKYFVKIFTSPKSIVTSVTAEVAEGAKLALNKSEAYKTVTGDPEHGVIPLKERLKKEAEEALAASKKAAEEKKAKADKEKRKKELIAAEKKKLKGQSVTQTTTNVIRVKGAEEHEPTNEVMGDINN